MLVRLSVDCINYTPLYLITVYITHCFDDDCARIRHNSNVTERNDLRNGTEGQV